MIKRFCLCLIAFFIFTIQPIKALNYYENGFLLKLNEYRACVEKKQQDNALKIIAYCSSSAEKNPYLSYDLKILCWSLYLTELGKRNITFGDAFTKYLDLICSYGYKYDGKPKSYGIELLVASFFILKSKIMPSEYTFCLVKALRILTRLEEMKIQPIAEKEYEPFYKILYMKEKDFNRAHRELLQYTDAMKNISGQKWFLSALSGIIKEGFSHTALYCMHQSEEKNFADAWAMHGYTCEYGIGTSKDLDQAIKYYKQAADKGSVWGKIGYANFMINGDIVEKDYGQALNLLNSVVDEPDFLMYGGGYQLGRLYENGWGVEVNREKAVELYTDSYEVCFQGLKKLSYEGSLRLENKICEELIDAELAGVDISQMSADELSAIAQRYEQINATSKATYFELQAAKKGNSYSACKIGMKYFYLSKGEKDAELEYALKMFEMGSKGHFAPCKYNLAVMYLFGYGTSPNYEKALDLYNKYIEQASTEGDNWYSEKDYLRTREILFDKYHDMHREEAIKEGKPLKNVLDLFNNPEKLYSWAGIREKSLRPEVIIYFYTRAAQKGHPEAAKRLEAFKKKLQKNKSNSKQ